MRKVLRRKAVLFCRSAKQTLFIVSLSSVSLLSAQMAMATSLSGTTNPVSVRDEITVSGTVYDEKGGVLPGVSVSVKGTSIVTISNADGKYSIKVPNDNAVLVFTYVGYNKQEVLTKGKTTVNTQLTANAQSLNELVVVGYGTQKKSTLAGSVAVVKGSDLVKSPQPNLSNSLAGRVSGVVINNRGGEPGYDGSKILIRGLGTTTNSDVLVVVDGIPGQLGGLERIDPNDVESISVLKDASAAVYGNRAANGVILITTKKGKIGKPTVNYSFNQGFSMPTRLPKMADAATYAQIMNEINYDSNPGGGLNQSYTADQIQKFRDGSDPLLYPNTDWTKQTLKSVALQNQHSLSVSGGTEDVKYFVSLGKIYQDAIYKDGATKYQQYNFRTNIDANISKRLKIGLGVSGREEDRVFPISGAGDIFRSVYRAKPIVAAYYPNGLPTTGIENSNPAVQVTDLGGIAKNPTQVINAILRGSYQIPGVEGLSVDGFFSVDKTFSFKKNFNKPYNLYSYDQSTGIYNTVVVGGSGGKATLYESQANTSLITSNVKLNYDKKFGKHSINAFVAYEQSRQRFETFDAQRLNYISTSLPELSQGGAAATDLRNSGSSTDYPRQSYIGKVTYNYDEKYIIEGQMRADGSSLFPQSKRFGYFPSILGAWRVSKEKWFSDNVSFINDLKIRGSYGSLGSDLISPYQYFDNYTLIGNGFVASNPGSGVNVIQPNVNLVKLANPIVGWERANKLDIGINATFLKNFTLEAIYFNQKRSDILLTRNASIPGTSGIVNPFPEPNNSAVFPLVPSENIGKINSSGVEASLGYNHSSENFSWGATGNITYAKSKIIFIDEASGTLDYQRQTGRPIGSYLLFNSLGIFRTQQELDAYPHVTGAKVGDLKYEDYNGDGVIDFKDRTRTKYGNVPEITYGLNLTASYKNFDVAVLFAGQSRVSQYVLPESGSVGNFYSSWADNRFSPSNPNGTFPRVTERASNAISGGAFQNNFWLNNASFLRLKNIELGYNFNSSLLSKIKISGVRLYASAFNLFTISKVKDYDPEGDNESGQFYPQQKIINIGANVKF
ncbi:MULTISPECIES: SusC/RagA family TonB-linked outer membrane protein [unclassified Pedobacter]|uniref:SusC/RagA family TonB-linked outer membrane protein n=1 Tax=unclassified Pedobacter TaxID=2628915 RepID=UPI0022477326|nr:MULTISPECIES: TonB-dependent receptor [unclassified Pedobacter]MCX2429414.1 TonB-dependent receptor [Pedobacter sp. GR22-10]MCX2584191.1 TonB-dependent receptor [Pedobacter sp. MR22-3]